MGTMMDEMQALVDECIEDYAKAKSGMKLPGTRVRKKMLKIKQLATNIRKEIIECRDSSKKS